MHTLHNPCWWLYPWEFSPTVCKEKMKLIKQKLTNQIAVYDTLSAKMSSIFVRCQISPWVWAGGPTLNSEVWAKTLIPEFPWDGSCRWGMLEITLFKGKSTNSFVCTKKFSKMFFFNIKWDFFVVLQPCRVHRGQWANYEVITWYPGDKW